MVVLAALAPCCATRIVKGRLCSQVAWKLFKSLNQKNWTFETRAVEEDEMSLKGNGLRLPSCATVGPEGVCGAGGTGLLGRGLMRPHGIPRPRSTPRRSLASESPRRPARTSRAEAPAVRA